MKKQFILFGLVLFAFALSQSVADTGGKSAIGNNQASISTTSYQIQDRIWNTNASTQFDGVMAYLFQDFEGTTFPPAGWTLEFTGTQYWTRFSGASGYGSGLASAKFDFYGATAGTTQSMVTPTMSATIAGDSLRFDHAYATYVTENDQLVLETSANGGSTYTVLMTLNGGVSGELVTAPPQTAVFVPTASQWATKRFALPVGTNKIRFRAVSAYGNNLYVDNIRIGTPLANDVGMQSIDITNPTGSGSQIPKATVKNFGTATQTFPATMLISPGGYSSTQNVTSLASNASLQVLFGNWSPTPGTYSVTVFTNLGSDGDRANDTMRANITVSGAVNGNWAPLASYPAGAAGGIANFYWPDSGKVFVAGGSGTVQLTNCYFYNPVTNTYAAKASLPIGRAYGKMVRVRDSLYYVGSIGANFAAPDGALYRYNPRTDSWTTKASTPSPLIQEMAVCVWRDSLIITVGGSTNGFTAPVNSVRVYNPFTDTWTVLAAPFPATAMGLAAECIGNDIIVLGGVIAGPAISNIAYRGTIIPGTPISISWRAITNPYGEGVYRAATALWSGHMMFGPTQKGASPPLGKLYGIKIADSTVASFLPDLTPPLGNIPNMAVRTTADSVFMYTFGGYNGTATVATCSRYGFRAPAQALVNPDTACYAGPIPAYPTGMFGHASENLGDTIYVVGGSSTGAPSTAVYTYSMTSRTWRTGVPLPTAKSGGDLIKSGGSLYYIGGGSTAITTGDAAQYKYTPGAGWTAIANIPTPVTGNNAEAWGDSVIFCIAGGWSTYLTTIQVYRPGSNTWSTSTPLPVGRRTQAAGLWEGKIFVAAGFSGTFRNDFYIGTIGSNANTITWVAGPNVPLRGTGSSRPGGHAVNGRFYFVTGETTPAPAQQDSVYIWNIAGSAWLPQIIKGRGTGTGSNYWGVVSSSVLNNNVTIWVPGGSITGTTTWGLYALVDDCRTVDVEPTPAAIPSEYKLSQNYPNPFNPITKIQYGIPEASTIRLTVYNILGQEVATLASGEIEAGTYEAIWNGRNASGSLVASGVYFYRLEAKALRGGSGYVDLKKMILLK